MIEQSKKIEILSQFKNEAEFRSFLLELLIRMGFNDVKETHGKNEKGKDIIGKLVHKIEGEEWYSFVVKYGKITGRATSIMEIISQVNESIHLSYTNHNGVIININKVKLITNGSVTDEAKDKLHNHSQLSNKNNFSVWINTDLIHHIDKHYSSFWNSTYFGEPTELINRNNFYDVATKLFLGSKSYRASNVGPTFLHPDWLLRRSLKKKINGLSLDIHLKNRILSQDKKSETYIFLRNVKSRYENKLDKYVDKNERSKFKDEMLTQINNIPQNGHFKFVCSDIGHSSINLIYDHHILNTFRANKDVQTKSGLLISNPKDLNRQKKRFDDIFKSTNTGFKKEKEKLSGFIKELWN